MHSDARHFVGIKTHRNVCHCAGIEKDYPSEGDAFTGLLICNYQVGQKWPVPHEVGGP